MTLRSSLKALAPVCLLLVSACSATHHETVQSQLDRPDSSLRKESGQTVLKGAVGLFGSCTMIGSPTAYGFADAGTGRSWLALLSKVKWVPLLPT